MDKTLKARFRQRADTAANWTAKNPILLNGEMGIESISKNFKFGDGKTDWDSLKYVLSNVAVSGSYNDLSNKPTIPVIPSDAKFTDTTYDDMSGATSSVAGKSGLVPAPAAGDQNKFLCADGTWKKADGTVFISTFKDDNPLVWLEIEGG